eukprot:364950-Chlamydomonas_euryale.AAC.6
MSATIVSVTPTTAATHLPARYMGNNAPQHAPCSHSCYSKFRRMITLNKCSTSQPAMYQHTFSALIYLNGKGLSADAYSSPCDSICAIKCSKSAEQNVGLLGGRLILNWTCWCPAATCVRGQRQDCARRRRPVDASAASGAARRARARARPPSIRPLSIRIVGRAAMGTVEEGVGGYGCRLHT